MVVSVGTKSVFIVQEPTLTAESILVFAFADIDKKEQGEKKLSDIWQQIAEYFKDYEQKLAVCKNPDGSVPYETPDQKSRMYAYISAFKRSHREKELFKNKKDWNFVNSEYWNLDSDELKPLVTFICNMFEEA